MVLIVYELNMQAKLSSRAKNIMFGLNLLYFLTLQKSSEGYSKSVSMQDLSEPWLPNFAISTKLSLL